MMAICLRSIRKHSQKYNLEVIVVDNASRDGSLDYLRSLSWIRLIERPDQGLATWPMNIFTSWDVGIRATQGDFFVCLHTDVFVKRDDWLDPLLREISVSPNVAASGAWKLALENPLYAFQKRVVGSAVAGVKRLFGRRARSSFREGHYPRDYCAMYRTSVLVDENLSFCPEVELTNENYNAALTGGIQIARRLWSRGYETRMIPVWEMAQKIAHVAHGTAAAGQKPLHHRIAQRKVERRARALLAESWVEQLRRDTLLDAA